MKVKDLKERLITLGADRNVTNTLTSISHWTKAIFMASEGKYAAGPEKDVAMLKKLEALGLVEVEGGAARLTKDGKELYMDFLGHGYYGV